MMKLSEKRRLQMREVNRRWREKNMDQSKQSHRDWVRNNPAQYILSRTKTSAKRRGIPFDLTLEDLNPLPTHCPILGLELKYNQGDDSLTSKDPALASLDRRNNDAGYIAGNVVIVSLRANQLKRDAIPEELRLLADFYSK